MKVVEKSARYTLPLLFMVLFFIAACGASKENLIKAKTHMDIGTAYIEASKYNMAIVELTKAEVITPDDPKVHYYLSMAYHSMNLDDKAMPEVEKAVKIKKDYSEAYNLQGTIYMVQKKYDEAISAFDKALSNALYETPTAALYNLGMAYYQKGMYRMAVSKFQEAENREPTSVLTPVIQINMAWSYFALGETDQAIERFQKLVSSSPGLVEPYYGLGRCYLEKKDKKQAAAAFRNVIRLAPDTEMAAMARENLKNLGAPAEESNRAPAVIEKKAK